MSRTLHSDNATMLCRAVVAALAISYLICVLWLSGLQKEDLDVNMLRKLQRHNVNIDNLNNDNLRQDCLESKSRKNYDVENSTLKEDELTTDTSTIENNSTTDKSKLTTPIDLSAMLKTIIEKQTLMQNKENRTTSNKEKDEREPIVQKPVNIGTTLISPLKIISNTIEVKNDNGKPNLETIFQFWQTFTTPNTQQNKIVVTTTRTTTHQTTRPVKKSIFVNKDTSAVNMEYMTKFLKDYLDEKLKNTVQTTTAYPVDLSKVFHQMQQLFTLVLKTKSHESDGIIRHDAVASQPILPKQYDPRIKIDHDLENGRPQQEITIKAREDKYLKSNIDKPLVQNIRDMLLINDQIKQSHLVTNQTNSSQLLKKPKHKQLSHELPHRFESVPYSFPPSTTKVETVQILPIEIIREITENVKASVLKDLRQEVSSSTFSVVSNPTTQTTVSTASVIDTTITIKDRVATDKNTNQNDTETIRVLKHIAELFENINVLKDNVFLSSIAQESTKKNSEIGTYNTNPLIDEKNIERDNKYKKVIKPIEIPFALPKRNQMSKTELRKENKMPTGRNNVYNDHNLTRQKYVGASIIQTNSGEIQPLNIPVSKPVLLIHQNIVLTTMKSKTALPWLLNHHTKKEYSDEIKNLRQKIKKYRGHTALYKALPTNDAKYSKYETASSVQLMGSDGYKNVKYSKSKIDLHPKDELDIEATVSNNKKNKHNINKYFNFNGNQNADNINPHNGYDDNITVGIFRDQNRERFHERLERVDDWKDSRDVGDREKSDGNLSLASRQQISLNNMKARYDDTHFRNFLKTQQKVNDMLERILATKMSRPRSVETT